MKSTKPQTREQKKAIMADYYNVQKVLDQGANVNIAIERAEKALALLQEAKQILIALDISGNAKQFLNEDAFEAIVDAKFHAERGAYILEGVLL